MKSLIFAFLFCLVTASGFAQIAAPENVKQGEAVHFVYEQTEPGDLIRWEVLNPFPEPELNVIRTKYGADLVVDPPCNWAGKIRVQCIAVGKDERVRFIGTKTVNVEGEVKPEPGPKPEPEPNPEPKPEEYNGPNALGVGKVSFDEAPIYNQQIADIMRAAGNYLKGIPELKVIYTDDKEKNATDYNVLVWVRKALEPYPAWADWHNAVFEQGMESGIKAGTPINIWVDFFNEAAAGVEAKK